MALVALQGKVLPEVLEQFKQAQENSENETFNQFVEKLLEAYLNPKTKQVEVPRPTAEQLQEIQLKDNEIGRLKSDISLKAAEVEALGEESRLLSKQLFEVTEKLKNQEPGAVPDLSDDQIIITIPPIMSEVLNIEKEVAKKKSGKDWTIGDLLLNNFWESITNGASHPFRIWSRGELSKLAKDIKEVHQV